MNKIVIVIMFILLGTSLIVLTNSNKGIENSFKIEYHNNKNLAMPDLTGKTEIIDGVYRLSTAYGLTWDYNKYKGQYIINGTSTENQGALPLKYFPELGSYTLSFQYVTGSMDVNGIGLAVSVTPPYVITTYLYVEGLNNIGPSKTHNHTEPFTLYLITWLTGITYDNYTFTIQLEKGNQATLYEVPKLYPVYVDNLTIEEKQEIGLGAFGGFTQIIRSIDNVIKPIGKFINGLLSLF